MAKKKQYKFSTVLERQPTGFRYHCFYFPYHCETEFGKKGHVRVNITINKHTYQRSLIPQGDGKHYVILGGDIRKKAGIGLGDRFEVILTLDTKPRTLDIPAELQAVFELEPLVNERFHEKLPSGTKHNICYWINSAKREETRTKRALDMMNRLLMDQFEMGGRSIDMT